MTDHQFMRGTLILFATSIILKILGFFYQIVTIRLIGTEPVGILNMAYPFYIAFVVLATAGIPLAIAKLIAEQRSRQDMASIRRTMKLAFSIVFLLSGCFLLLSIILMPMLFGHLHSDPRMVWCYYMLLPGIIIVPISSIIRGYFQGLQQMVYPSLGQIAEQLVRLTTGLCFIVLLKPYGVRFIAVGLAGGMMAGELAGMLLIAVFYRHSIKKWPKPVSSDRRAVGRLLKEIMALGIPTTLTRLTSTLDMAFEASLIPFCLLQMGYDQSQATSIYGQVSGVALTLLTIPMVLTGALATSLVPAISKASAAHHRQEMAALCSEAIRLTYIFSLPIIIVLFCYGGALTQILFHIGQLGPLLRILTLGAIFLYVGQTTVGIMQGLGQTQAVFINNLLGAVAKLVCIYFFVAQRHQGTSGIALAFVLGYIAQCLLNLLSILKEVSLRLSAAQVLLPLANGVFMLLLLPPLRKGLAMLLGPTLGLLCAIVAGGLIYFALLVLTRQFRLDLHQLLPHSRTKLNA